MEWNEQYRHPKWQKKRLEALEKAEFMCQSCYDAESQLHVHHKQYIKGRKIWEYEVSELAVLCEHCHESAHEVKDVLSELICLIHPEGITDVIAIMAGYCHYVRNPSRVDATKTIEKLGSPYSVTLGALAAAFSNINTPVYVMQTLIEQLEASTYGGEVDLVIRIPKKPKNMLSEF